MNYFVILNVLAVCFLSFCSCSKEDQPRTKNIPIISELEIYYRKNLPQELIKEKEIINKVLILNSEDEVEKEFTPSFLDEFRDYTNIDFNKYTLLVRTSIVDYEIMNRKIFFYKKITEGIESFNLQIDYYVGNQCSENEYYIERVAVIIDKLENIKKIEIGTSITENYN